MTTPRSRLTVRQIAKALEAAGLSGVTLHDLHEAALTTALARHNGNKTHAAKELGISLRTLQRQIQAGRLEADA